MWRSLIWKEPLNNCLWTSCWGSALRTWLVSVKTRVQSLASLIAVSYGVGQGRGSDPALLWLWGRPAATALIRPLAWETPSATGAALEKAKRQNKQKRNLEACFKIFSRIFICLNVLWSIIFDLSEVLTRDLTVTFLDSSLDHVFLAVSSYVSF